MKISGDFKSSRVNTSQIVFCGLKCGWIFRPYNKAHGEYLGRMQRRVKMHSDRTGGLVKQNEKSRTVLREDSDWC